MILNFFLENIAALVACYADASASFWGTLHLFACRALEVSVVFAVAVQPAAERSVKVCDVPVELGAHLYVFFRKDSAQ